MKILLVNNHTIHLNDLHKALAGHDIETVIYEPGTNFNYHDKDMIVLSGGGGEGLEIDDRHQGKLWYADEMEMVLTADKPILGICMGFEVIARAYGSKVKQLSSGLVEGFIKFDTNQKGRLQLSEKTLTQFESHQWHVDNIDTGQFDILATSNTGIEIIKHMKRPIFATQFHPEKGGTLKLPQLLTI
jgi:GMP synthase (glutamine-hydrolysing)